MIELMTHQLPEPSMRTQHLNSIDNLEIHRLDIQSTGNPLNLGHAPLALSCLPFLPFYYFPPPTPSTSSLP